MTDSLPGKTITVGVTGLQSGLDIGFQVIKAASGTVAIGRTTAGIAEVPTGSGAYAATFVAPAEPELYFVIFDWNDGVIDSLTSVVVELMVNETASTSSTGLGRVADYARVYLGGETWDGIYNSSVFGATSISLAVEVIKSRVMLNPPVTVNEADLPAIVLSYLGKLTALELLPAARVWWSSQLVSKSIGNDPVEIVTHAARDHMLDEVQNELLRQIARDAPVALALIDTPRLRPADDGPAIDEDDFMVRVTEDPRNFPTLAQFPFGKDFIVPNRARFFTVVG